MLKVVDIVNRACEAHHKQLIVRTFVWAPEELSNVMKAVDQLPKDMVIMSKAVPQDWQMRGGNAAEIGAVGGRPQIEEYDAAGEYFLKDAVANCMVDILKRQFDYGVSKNIQGICVRVDRENYSVLFQPQEVNLWTLGLLASGASNDVEDIWSRWATYRYGAKAAPAVIQALKPTSDVVAELLSIGPFHVRRHARTVPGLGKHSGPLAGKLGRIGSGIKSYQSDYDKAEHGDPAFIAGVEKQKADAMTLADQCLSDLEAAKPNLAPNEYAILHTKLLSNKFQLSFRGPMVIAALHYNTAYFATRQIDRSAALDKYHKEVAKVRAIADTLVGYGDPKTIDYLGRNWTLDVPLGVTRDMLYHWVSDADKLTIR